MMHAIKSLLCKSHKISIAVEFVNLRIAVMASGYAQGLIKPRLNLVRLEYLWLQFKSHSLKCK